MQDMGFSCRIPCVKPLLNNRQRQKRLAWAKDKKDWTAAEWSKVMFSDESNFAFPLEIRVPESGGRERGTESTLLEVQCKVSTVSDGLGCHVICWCWSTVFSEVQGQHSRIPGSFRALMLPAADQLYGDAISFSNRTWHLHTVPKLPVPGLRTMVSLFLIGQQTRLTLTPHRKSMGYCEEEDAICQTQQCRRAEGHYQSNLGSHNTWAVHRLIDSMPRRIAAVIQAKGAPTKYWVLYMLILFMFILFSWPRFLKILSLYWS